MPKRQVRKRRSSSHSEKDNDNDDAAQGVLAALAEATLPLGRSGGRTRPHGLAIEAAESGDAGKLNFSTFVSLTEAQ
jgi:hypothetical protein